MWAFQSAANLSSVESALLLCVSVILFQQQTMNASAYIIDDAGVYTQKQKQKSAWRPKKKTNKNKKNQQKKTNKKTKKPNNNGYDPQKDQINTLDRRTQTTIFRLRTGHCGLRKHLKRLGLAYSAHCECGSEEQTPEHILQTCPHLETVHQQFWPEDTEVGTKLWGQAAELQRTADFLAATGLRI